MSRLTEALRPSDSPTRSLAALRGAPSSRRLQSLAILQIPLIHLDGIIPGKTYAWSIAMSPMTAAPATECHQTVRKIGPIA